MKPNAPLSNGSALLITVGVAAAFFALFMMMPSPESRRNEQPSSSRHSPVQEESVAVLFATRCTQCHALPALTHRSFEDWRILVMKMNRYMKQTGRRSLTDKEAMDVTRYIVKNQK